MTQKTPKAPDAPKTTTATKPTVSLSPELRFWEIITELHQETQGEGFGTTMSFKTGGSTKLKDTEAIKSKAKELFSKNHIHYDVSADDDVKVEPTNSGFIVHGHYTVKWFYKGVLVHTNRYVGAFDERSSSKAVHGSLTNAISQALFTILQIGAKSEEELEMQRDKASNRQEERQPVKPIGGKPF